VTFQPQVLQDPEEMEAFVGLLASEGVRSYLEIGTKFGGMFWRVGQALAAGALMVSVDLPAGTRAWSESERSLRETAIKLEEFGHDVRLIFGDSTKPTVTDRVRALSPFDAVLIDANHTLPYVSKDWANYGPLAKIVAFHDISWHRAPEWVGTRIDVPQFWQSIKGDYRHVEFKFCPTRKNNGIGVLWR
jgi:predicted O-methyltransferase YrrM